VLRPVDISAFLGALLLHAGIAVAMLTVKPAPPRPPDNIDVDLVPKKKEEPPPPKLTEPEPPKPEPEKKIVKVEKAPPPPTPVPNQEPPKEPPKEVKPIFGVTMESTTDSDGPAVNVGNTTMMDPKKSGTGIPQALPPGKVGADPTPQAYKPVADIYVKTLPEIDGEACARMVTYPQEAEQAGIEGEIKLRVALDEQGKVHDIKVLSGLGHGLDQAAMNALKYRCKFKPAVDTTGKPVAYVIQTYTWTFELPR
jgi:protein TonB